MTRDGSQASGPLARWVNVERLPQGRGAVTVEASPAECAALAADFGIPGIRDLVGRFAIAGSTSRLTVRIVSLSKRSARIRFAVSLAPTTSWWRKLTAPSAPKRRVAGLPTSCTRAEKRRAKSGAGTGPSGPDSSSAACSRTVRECW